MGRIGNEITTRKNQYAEVERTNYDAKEQISVDERINAKMDARNLAKLGLYKKII